MPRLCAQTASFKSVIESRRRTPHGIVGCTRTRNSITLCSTTATHLRLSVDIYGYLGVCLISILASQDSSLLRLTR
ncbi:hypothetical protein FA15DRAFT_88379 [Coprinopsis marcescibilis]|uniref:Uncharacterized protein n=1 Tax=Coprinopsis marcescibilis TaxID=230819 RepID=A0A5C3L6I0_COPMA|nr:hypothetical protein FA15DRAFT_88379 [Coprinopsis marcescibilis]